MVVDLWQRTEKRDRTRFLIISGVSIAVVIVAMLLLTRTEYITLYKAGVLSDESVSEVAAALDEQNIAHKIGGDGSVLVAENSKGAAITHLADNNIPKGLNRDLSIYQSGGGLTATSEQQRQYLIFQAEETIRRTVSDMENINDAVVMIAASSGRPSIVQADKQITTASIHLNTIDGNQPTAEVVKAAQYFAATAFTGLLPENVTVTWPGGLLGEISGYEDYDNRLEMKNQVESDFAASLRALLDPVLGYDNYTLGINAVLDFDEHTTNSTTFTPSIDDEGIVESMQTVSETANGYGVAVGEPGMDENGGGDVYDETETSNGSYYEKTSETVNFKVNQINEQIIHAGGSISDITVSIMLDQDVLPEEAAFSNGIRSIIGGTVGISSDNTNEKIRIMRSAFVGKAEEDARREEWEAQQARERLFELLRQIALYLIIGVCVILLIVKTYKLLKKEPTEEELLADAIAMGYDPDADLLMEMATLGEITEAPKSQFREQIEKFIDKNPNAVADLLRNWLNDEFG
jgi:flagellar M-ring protein FliF